MSESPSDFAEANWLIDEIKHLLRDQGTEAAFKRQEIAVLYRSNAQSRVVETALFNAGIPYRVYGGLRFFERAEIKHALAYLRLIENPRDDTSFLRAVNFPPRGIGARSLEQLQDLARESGCALHDAVSALTGKAGTNIGGFVAKIDVLREQAAALTLRENQVLNELARGHPNKTIGYDLGISSRTVEIHRANVMRKLGVHSFPDALRVAFAAGMPVALGRVEALPLAPAPQAMPNRAAELAPTDGHAGQ